MTDSAFRTMNDVGMLRIALAILGCLLAALVVGAFAYNLWRKKRIKKPDGIALVVLLCLGVSLSGFAFFGIPAAPPPQQRPFLPAQTGPDEEIDATALKQLKTASLATSAPGPASSDDWPQWRGPNRDGISPATTLNTNWERQRPAVVWKVPVDRGYSSPVVANGRVYTLDCDGEKSHERVLCLDARTGQEVWSYSYDADNKKNQYSGPRATPTIYEGKVYTVGSDGLLLCLLAEPPDNKPHVLWKHDLLDEFAAARPGHGFTCSPLIEGELVIVQPGGPGASVVAFNRNDGKLVWKALDDPSGYSSPIAATAAGARQIVCFTGKRTVGLRAEDGSLLWANPWLTAFDTNIATPIVAGDYVFFSSGYEAGCALLHLVANGRDMKAVPVYIKRRRLMRNHHSTCVLHEEHLYGCDSGRHDLKCVSLRTGEEKWATPKFGKHCLIYAAGHLVLLGEDGSLALVEANPKEFKEKGQMQSVLDSGECWALPALAGGFLYLRDHHNVVCLDLRAKKN
jgi:outer membrane protein assembly factor BamB